MDYLNEDDHYNPLNVGELKDVFFELDEEFLEEFKYKEPPLTDLGKFTFYRTYSRYKDDGSMERWWEAVQRVVEGTYTIQKRHCLKNNLPWSAKKANNSAKKMYKKFYNLLYCPPGRGIWQMGTDFVYERGSMSLNNCAFCSTKDITTEFAEPFCFLMICSSLGVGVGGDTRGAGKLTIKEPRVKEGWTYTVPDSREGWTKSVRILLNGYGHHDEVPEEFDYSEIRPRGADIESFGGTASGPEPLKELHNNIRKLLERRIGEKITSTDIVDLFNLIGKCIVAGGVRRTAEVMFGDKNDTEFIKLKDPDEQTDFWGEPENQHHRWCSNNSLFAEVGMDYKFSAERIHKNGEPGMQYLENAREYGRMKDGRDGKDRRVQGANPCVPKDTVIFTESGPEKVENLIGEEFNAVVDNESYFSDGFFKTGTKPVYRIKTKQGHEIKATEDHKILTSPKVTSKKRYEEYKCLCDISVGDKIVLNNNKEFSEWSGQGSFGEGWLLGSCLGDGSIDEESGCIFRYWGEEKDLLDIALGYIEDLNESDEYNSRRTGCYVEERDYKETQSIELYKRLDKFGVDDNKNFVSDKFLTFSSDFQKGLIRGFFDADGTVLSGKEKGVSVRLNSSTLQHLRLIQKSLLNFGINSSIYKDRQDYNVGPMPDGKGGEKEYQIKNNHELVVTCENLVRFHDIIGFHCGNKKQTLKEIVGSYKKAPDRERFVDEVVSIEYDGVEDVYDCNVEEKHAFGADGVIVHNCLEQSLEDHELCCLVETFPARHESMEEWKETLKYAYLYAKTVTLIPTQVPKTNNVMMRNRRIGCSMSGITQAFDKFGRREFFDSVDDGYERIQELDKKYSDWLCVPRSKKTTSVKPSGTVSLLNGASSGVHFPESEYYIRNVRVQGTSDLIKACEKAGYDIEEDKYSDDTYVISFPVKVENFSYSKDDISMWEQLEIVAQIQHYWSDNQVSATVTFDPDTITPDEIKRALELYETRLKSISFLPKKDHGYEQAPQIKIGEEEYEELNEQTGRIKYSDIEGNVHEEEAEDKFCDSDSCEVDLNE